MPRPHPLTRAFMCGTMVVPHSLTPDWAESLMERITKFDDPDVLSAALELVVGLAGLNDSDRLLPARVRMRDDAAQAAVDYGYRKTDHCQQCETDFLGLAV